MHPRQREPGLLQGGLQCHHLNDRVDEIGETVSN